MYKILIADDEAIIRSALCAEIQEENCEITLARDGREASEQCRNTLFDIVVLDICMPYKDGLSVLREIKGRSRETTVIMITAHGTIDSAVMAMKMGADDYITKPFDNAEFHQKIRQHIQVKQQKQRLPARTPQRHEAYFGQHPTMLSLERKIEKIKDLNTTVLITGESGTGKGVVARELHRRGNRSHLPFIHVDCAFLPHNLIESELFGHERGAFTSANTSKKGKFELAGKGTIFLDEIGTLPLDLQAKLLNVLQERCIDKIGGVKKIPMEARVIAATNEDLEMCVAQGSFREDLFYRLNVIRLEIPPLRYRKTDIQELAKLFIAAHSRNMGRQIEEIEPSFWACIRGYDWPGNVRELENAIESALALCDDNILRASDLPIRVSRTAEDAGPAPSAKPAAGGEPLNLEQQEILTITAALERNGGHRENTARELGISRRALQYKLKRFHIT